MSAPHGTEHPELHHTHQPLNEDGTVAKGNGSTRTPSISETSDVPEKRGIVAASNIVSVITTKDIHIAYAAYFLLALGFNFANYTQQPFTPFATSAFKSHSQLSAAGVINRVFSMAAYGVVPKLCDNIGRISPTLLLVLIIFSIIGDAMMAGCKNVQTYIGANVFSGLGSTGYTIATQIYFASTTNIVSRAFWNVAADSISAIITMYSGAEIGGRILDAWGVQSGWRWGYGMWCIINAVLAIPFLSILYSWHMRARKTPGMEPLPPHGSILHQAFHEYDIVGMILFIGGLALVLVPVTLAKGLASKWDGGNIAMLCVGIVMIVLFVIWSLPKRVRPPFLFRPKFPLIPWHTLKSPTVLGLFIINMFDFMSYGCFTTYFPSFLQVAVRTSAARAAQIDNTLRIVFQVFAILIAVLMRFWGPITRRLGLGERRFHTAYSIWFGIPLCTLGIGIDIYFVQRPRASNAVASFVVGKLIYGVGRGLFQTTGQVAVQAAAKRQDLGIATGIFYTGMSLGGAIGVALAGVVWNNILPDALFKNLPAESKGMAKQLFGNMPLAIKADPNSAVGIAVLDSYVETMKIMAIVATCLQIPMLISMLFVKDVALTEEEQYVEAGRRLALNNKNQRSLEEK